MSFSTTEDRMAFIKEQLDIVKYSVSGSSTEDREQLKDSIDEIITQANDIRNDLGWSSSWVGSSY